MIRGPLTLILLITLGIPADAQSPLSLADAISRAKTGNLDVRAATAAEREAGQRKTQARAGYLPKVDFVEAWQRSNQPVFVFSSLLAQRSFTADDFALDALNYPPALANFRAGLTIEQPVFNPVVPSAMKAADLGHETALVTRARIDQDVAVAVTEAYGQVLVADASKRASAAAVEAAEASRGLATSRRDAGLATDADVLLVDVHLARARQRQIQSDADERVARARLNHLMGESLDAMFEFTRPPDLTPQSPHDVPSLERVALEQRPEVKLASLNVDLAQATHDAARAAFFPEFGVQAGWEANGDVWESRTTSWMVGAVARVNLFRGLSDRARLAEARETISRRTLERENAETKARLEVRVAIARLDGARASLAAGRTALAEASESSRIIRDRYEGGLADVVSLLRAAEAVQQAEEAQIRADVDVMVAAARLDRVLGR